MDSFDDHLVSVHDPLPLSHGGLQLQFTADDGLAQTDPIVLEEKKASLIMALRDRVQKPPLGPFCMEDLIWIDHVTCGKGNTNPLSLPSFCRTDWTISLRGNKAILISFANTPKKP
jgi:hypothetical protein